MAEYSHGKRNARDKDRNVYFGSAPNFRMFKNNFSRETYEKEASFALREVDAEIEKRKILIEQGKSEI